MRFQRVKDKNGEVCYALQNWDKTILIPVEDYKEATRLGISNGTIKKNMEKGIRHFRKYVRDYDVQQGLARLKREDREREERKQALAEEKQRKEQERLQMIEKHRVSTKWFKHLCENDIFPKVVKQMNARDMIIDLVDIIEKTGDIDITTVNGNDFYFDVYNQDTDYAGVDLIIEE